MTRLGNIGAILCLIVPGLWGEGDEEGVRVFSGRHLRVGRGAAGGMGTCDTF